jgi:hypothetical protein
MKPPDPGECVVSSLPTIGSSDSVSVQNQAGSAAAHGFPDGAYNPTPINVQFALQLTGPDPNTRHLLRSIRLHKDCHLPPTQDTTMHNIAMLDDLRISTFPVPNPKLQTRNQKPAYSLSFTSSELPAALKLAPKPTIAITFSNPEKQNPLIHSSSKTCT